LIRAPIGLILIGTGLSMAIDAGVSKFDGAEMWVWIAYGTASLVVFNAGISIFGDAVRYKVLMDLKK
jgi:hypothetical protein